MDEIIFRISQTIEYVQIIINHQIRILTVNGKQIVIYVSESSKNVAGQIVNSNLFEICKGTLFDLFNQIRMEPIKMPKQYINYLIEYCVCNYHYRRENVYYLSGGIVIGLCSGYLLFRNVHLIGKMKAIIVQTLNNKNVDDDVLDRIILTEEIATPTINDSNEILIQVKASTVDLIDIDIALNNYAHFIRSHLNKYTTLRSFANQSSLVLGRACAGIVIEIGHNVTKFEIGDSVWVYAPFWANGTLSEYVVAKDYHVGKAPSKLNFEGAASIPYNGALVLNKLNQCNLNETNLGTVQNVLIIGCCTTTGCILTQILKQWRVNSITTTTCGLKADPVAKAMGSNCNIVLVSKNIDQEKNIESMIDQLRKELRVNDLIYDYIFVCDSRILNVCECLREFVKSRNNIVTMTYDQLKSDRMGFITRIILSIYFRISLFIQYNIFGRVSMYDDLMSNEKGLLLDELKEMIDMNMLQSVVEHIYSPQDYQQAIINKQSFDSIGSTIIKFTC